MIKNTPAHQNYGNFIVARSQDDKSFTKGDYDNYAEKNDESETKPNANRSWKWKHISKPILDGKDLYTGKGLTP